MAFITKVALLLLAALGAQATPGGLFYPTSHYAGGYSTFHHGPVLTVLEERPLAADPVSAPVPLLLVPQEQIHVVHGAVSGPARIKPFVQVKVHGHMEEAMPAVKVQLRRPILVSQLHSTIAFPTRFTVLHNGYSTPVPVGAVIAPLPTGFVPNHPATISYVYAVPSAAHYPAYYHQAPSYYPFYYAPSSTAVAAQKPVVPAKDPQVQQTRPQSPPIVTVLDFPSSVASPPTLFYQPPATGLGNREPPQAVAPAGIVQSTQPQPNLSVFINSKESPYLQILREEALRNRNKAQLSAEEQVVFVN